MTRRRAVLGLLLGLWLFGMGFLLGRLAEKLWFDHARGQILAELDDGVRRVRTHLMWIERGAMVICAERQP